METNSKEKIVLIQFKQDTENQSIKGKKTK